MPLKWILMSAISMKHYCAIEIVPMRNVSREGQIQAYYIQSKMNELYELHCSH